MLKRPLSSDEIAFLKEKCIVNFGLEFDTKSSIKRYLQKLENYMIGPHLYVNCNNLCYKKEISTPLRLPEGQTLINACRWVSHHSFPYSQSLSTIAYNNHQIVISSNHMVGDGIYYYNLVKDIQNPNCIYKEQPFLPVPLEEVFKREISEIDQQFVYRDKSQLSFAKTKFLQNDNSNPFCNNSYFSIPFEELQAYSKDTQQLKSITEYMWASLTLSINAYQNKLGPIGCQTCVDMRPLLPQEKKQNLSQYVNLFGFINAISPVSSFFTVEHLGQLLRNDFNMKLKRGDIFDFYAKEEKNSDFNGEIAELSQLPSFVIKKPITDICIDTTFLNNNFQSGLLTLTAYSIINQDHKKKNLVGFLRSHPSHFSKREADVILQSIIYFLQHIPRSASIKEAFHELRDFQSSIGKRKNKYSNI